MSGTVNQDKSCAWRGHRTQQKNYLINTCLHLLITVVVSLTAQPLVKLLTTGDCCYGTIAYFLAIGDIYSHPPARGC